MAIERISGECRVIFAFEAGYAIDLGRAESRLPASAREALPQSRRLPADSDFTQKPLRIAVERAIHAVDGHATAPLVEATIYDFGAISVSFRLPFDATLDRLAGFAASLWNNRELAAASRAVVEDLLRTLGDAVSRPDLRSSAEDFVVFVVDPASCGDAPLAVDSFGAARLAALLRLEDKPLSAEEIADAVQAPLAYGTRDLVVVDWAAAFVVDAEPAATLAVLEHANVQLTELKHLDGELDRGLDQIWSRANDRALFARLRLRANLRMLAELQIEGAALFDSVTNALKLYGDQHLARVQRAAARRFRIDDWEQSVARKLETFSSISERLEARQSQYRSELLEWIIIGLILFEIVQALW